MNDVSIVDRAYVQLVVPHRDELEGEPTVSYYKGGDQVKNQFCLSQIRKSRTSPYIRHPALLSTRYTTKHRPSSPHNVTRRFVLISNNSSASLHSSSNAYPLMVGFGARCSEMCNLYCSWNFLEGPRNESAGSRSPIGIGDDAVRLRCVRNQSDVGCRWEKSHAPTFLRRTVLALRRRTSGVDRLGVEMQSGTKKKTREK